MEINESHILNLILMSLYKIMKQSFFKKSTE